MRRTGLFGVAALGLLLARGPLTAVPEVGEYRQLDGVRLEDEAAEAPRARRGAGPAVAPAQRGDVELARALLARHRSESPGGSGASVERGFVLQSSFRDSRCAPPTRCRPTPCNAVSFFWYEPSPNDANLVLFANGQRLFEIAPLPPGTMPPLNSIEIAPLEEGLWTFRIQAPDGSAVEDSVRVLDSQPFSDPSAVHCGPGSGPRCDLRVTITPGAGVRPPPDDLGISLDGRFVGFWRGDTTEAIIPDVVPGRRCVSVVALRETAGGLYRGCFLSACCQIVCADAPCAPPRDLLVCQIAYGGEGQNVVRVSWKNTEDRYESIGGMVDGVTVARLDGDREIASMNGLDPGPRRIGLQARCGERGSAEIVETTIELLAASPHPNPIDGPLSCTFIPGPGEGRTWVTWKNLVPSSFVDLFIVSAGEPFFLGTLPGWREEAVISGTSPRHAVVLQFFARVDGQCYGSPLLACSPEFAERGYYLPAACDGQVTPTISSAINLLNYQFLGGRAPPCLRACDTNSDGVLDVSDAIYILSFLFIGGTPPVGWQGGRPTCVEIREDDDCAAPTPACVL